MAPTLSRIWWRIVPLSIAIIFFSALDRGNISFAAVTMNADLGLTNTAFGLVLGSFSIGYLLFCVPGALAMQRYGARRVLALMMVAWGLASGASALAQNTEQLVVMRFLLGAAEAGAMPGLIYYIGTWFPPAQRGRVFGAVFFIQPVVMILGAPVSTWLLTLDQDVGFDGWRLLFIVEALPTLLIAGLVLRYLPDSPAAAVWLSPAEREWIASETAAAVPKETSGAWVTLLNRKVLRLAFAYLCLGTVGAGFLGFLPLMIRTMDVSVVHTGLIASGMAILGALTLPFWGWWTDRSGRAARVAATTFAAMAAGLGAAALLLPSPWALACVPLAMVGFYGCVVPFWTLPSRFLTGAAAAGGIAVVNICGNLGQLTGPAIVGVLTDHAGSFALALAALAAVAALGAYVVLIDGGTGETAGAALPGPRAGAPCRQGR